MAYPVKNLSQKEIFNPGSAPATVPWPTGLIEGDEVYVYAAGLNIGTVSIAGAGTWYNLNGTGALSGNLWGFHQRVPAGGLTAPAISWTGSATWHIGVCVAVVRGANTTGPQTSEGAVVSGATTASSAVTPALTVTENPQLVMVPMTYERFAEKALHRATNVIDLIYAENNENSGHIALGYTYVSASDSRIFGADTSQISTTHGVNIAAHAVVDNGNAEITNYCKFGTSDLVLFNHGQQQGVTRTSVDVTAVSHTPQITGIVTHPITGNTETIDNEAAPITGGENGRLSLAAPNMGLAPQLGAGESDKFLTKGIDFTSSPLNLSNALINFQAELNKGVTRSASRFGRCIGFGDGTNAAFFLYSGQDDNKTGWDTFAIDTGSTGGTNYDTGTTNATTGYEIQLFGAGPLNWSSIKEVIWEVNGATADVLFAGCVYVEREPLTILGGYAANPIDFDAFYQAVSAGSLNTVLKQGNNQYFTYQNLRIGDGVRAVRFAGLSQVLEFPTRYNYDDKRFNSMADEERYSLTLLTSANCNIDLSNKAVNGGSFARFIVPSTASPLATYNLNGFPITSMTPELYGLSLDTYAGFIINRCREIKHANFNKTAGRTAGGLVIRNCVDPVIITIASKEEFEALLQKAEITNSAGLIKITGDQDNSAGAWSATGMTVSGGGGSYDIEYTGTTDFTIEFDVGSGFSQGRVDNSAAVTAGNTGLTVSTPTVSLTVTSNIAASDIKIFETGTQTIEASATGTSASTSVAGTYDWTVQKAGYLPQRGTGVVLGTSNVPVSVTLIKDPVYSASHGLAYTTDFTYNGITKKMTCVTRQAGRDFYSAMIDAFIAQSSLDNTPFPLTAVGIDSIFFNDDAELLDATSQDNWFDAGIRYINSSGTTTAEWCSIKSSGSIPAGVTGRYQTGAGTGTTALRTTGAVNQIIQIYGDATHGNFDHRSFLVIKFQANPYVDTRSDILALAGVSTLEPFEYSVAIEPTALDITAGDSGAVLTLVDHTAAPITVGGKLFSYEIQDGGTNSAENILRAWDYNIAQTGTYQGTDAFNLPEFVAQSGSTYETRRGIVETKGSTLYGCYVSRGGSDHPDFTRHQSDDGTYYDKPVTANITITNLPDDVGANTRLQIYNVTTATEYYSDDPAGTGYSASYTDGVGISAGDSIRIRFAHLNGATSFESGQTFATATSTGFSVDGSTFITANSVYADNALNGSTITKFTADFVNDELDVSSAANFTGPETWAFFCMTLTTANGINEWWGGYEAIDIGNYRNNASIVSMYFDETFGSTKRQTDSSRIFRSDGAYPVKDPTTTGYGVDINWQVPVYVKEVNTGSAVNKATVIEALTDQGYTSARAPKLDTIPDDVWQSPKAIPKLLSVE